MLAKWSILILAFIILCQCAPVIIENQLITSTKANKNNATIQTLTHDDSLETLVCAAESVILTEGLIIVVSASPDPDLNIPNGPIFNHLTRPSSLKASIFQIVTGLTNALRNSETRMYKIGLILKNLDFELAYEAIQEQTTDPDAIEFLKDFEKELKESASTCLDLANNTQYEFKKILDITEELNGACIARQAHDERDWEKLEKTKVEMSHFKEAAELRRKSEEEIVRETREKVKLLHEDLREQENDGASIGLIIKDLFSNGRASARWSDVKSGLQDRYKLEREALEKHRAELAETERQMANFTAMVKNAKLETMNLERVIQFIKDASKYLILLQKKWNVLTTHFTKITISIEENISNKAMKVKYLDELKRKFLVKVNNKLLIQIAGEAIAVIDTAEKYDRVCKNYVNPLLADVYTAYNLDMNQANERKNNIETKLNKVRNEVKKTLAITQLKNENDTKAYLEERIQRNKRAMKALYG